MKRIFELGFYCFYSFIVKKDGDYSHERASFGYAISFSMYIISLYFYIKRKLELKYIENKLIYFVLGIALFIIIVLLFSRYFRHNNRYLIIANRHKYDPVFLKMFYKILGLILLFSSFFIFAYSGFRYSQFLIGS